MKINNSQATPLIKVWSKTGSHKMVAGEYLLILPDQKKSEALFLSYFNEVGKADLSTFAQISSKFNLEIPEGSEVKPASSSNGVVFTVNHHDLTFTRKGETLDLGGETAKPLTPEEELKMLRAQLAAK